MVSLTKIGQAKSESKFVATVVENEVGETLESWDTEPRVRWVQKLKMLDIDNRDELGREIPRVSRNNVYGKSGAPAGQGSGVHAKSVAYAELLGVDDIDDGSMTVGKTFRFASRSIERGKDAQGNLIVERADVPIEYFPTGYTHPADKVRPVWQFKPRNVEGATNAAEVQVASVAVASQDEIDEILAKMFDGQSSAPTLQTLIGNSATKTKAVIDDVKSGAALTRLQDKGLLIEADGKYVKLS